MQSAIPENEVQSFIQPSDLVVTTSRDGMSAGGFKIDSALMAAGAPCAAVKGQKGGGPLAGLKGLAVPAGLLFLQRTMASNYIEYQNKDAVIEEGLYDKLVNLASSGEAKTSNRAASPKRLSKKQTKKQTKRQTTTARPKKGRGTRRSK